MQVYNKPLSVICVFCLSVLAFGQQAPSPIVAPVAPVAPLSISPVSTQSGMPHTNQTTTTTSKTTTTKTQNGEQTTTSAQPTQTGMSLSAANLSSLAGTLMGGSGNTEALSSLLNNAGLGGGQSTVGENPITAQVLQQILTRLDQIQQTVSTQNPVPAPEKNENDGKILRFSINNYNILDTCETLFFSDLSEDGSFLLTGDRNYFADGVHRKETFYLLFRKLNTSEYDIACTVSQDYENKNSFLYQLSQKQGVRGRQTGNFVTVHLNEPQWKMDLLIDCNYSQPMEDIEP